MHSASELDVHGQGAIAWPRPSRAVVALALWAGLIVVGAVWGRLLLDSGAELFLGAPPLLGTWDVRLANPGEVALEGVQMRVQVPPELSFLSATGSGQLAGDLVVWPVGLLRPGVDRRSLKQAQGGRRRDRIQAVCRPDGPAADVERRRHHTVDAKRFDRIDRADDVDD